MVYTGNETVENIFLNSLTSPIHPVDTLQRFLSVSDNVHTFHKRAICKKTNCRAKSVNGLRFVNNMIY